MSASRRATETESGARQRSALFGVSPLGAGTMLVEGLASYFVRLCARRRVGVGVALDVLVRPLAQPALRGTTIKAWHAGRTAARFDAGDDALTAALEVLTLREGLSRHTLAAFRHLWAHGKGRTLTGRIKRWCAQCWARWAARGEALYEPLLWRLAPVERCPVHRTVLLGRCPSCEHRPQIVLDVVPLGWCGRCGRGLWAGHGESAIEARALDDEALVSLWRSVSFARMLERASAGEPARGADAFRQLLLHNARERGAQRDVSGEYSLAVALNVSPVRWRALCADALPTAKQFVNVPLALGIDPSSVAFDSTLAAIDATRGFERVGDPWRLTQSAREARSARERPDRAAVIDAYIEAGGREDLRALDRAGKTSHECFERAFPLRFARARVVRARYVAERNHATKRRADEALKGALAQGGSLSAKAVARRLGRSATFLSWQSPVLYEQLLSLNPRRRGPLDKAVRERLGAALRAAVTEPGGPTATEVGRKFDLDFSCAKRACPEEFASLLAARRQEREELYARCREVLGAEYHGAPPPRSMQAIARELGTWPSIVRRSDPELYRAVLERAQKIEVERRRREEEARLEVQRELVRERRERKLRIERVRAALVAELESGALRSPHAVAVSERVFAAFARAHCRAEYDALRNAFGYRAPSR